MAWHFAAKADEIGDNEVIGVTVDGRPIAIYRIGDAFFATHNICTHEHALLSDGYLEGGCIECPIHQARFDVRTGAAITLPATEPVATYPVKVEEGRVLVELG